MDFAIEHVDEQLGEHRSDSARPAHENIGAQQHHGTHHVRRERLPYARRVAADQVELQLPGLLCGNPDVSKFAEAGVDAVHRLAALDRGLDCMTRLGHGVEGFAIDLHGRVFPGYGNNVKDCERMAIEGHRRRTLGHWPKAKAPEWFDHSGAKLTKGPLL